MGSIGVELQIAPGVVINTVKFTITNAASGFTQTGTVNEQFSNTISFQVGGVPAGDGYVITLSAMSTGGEFACTGAQTFNVTAGGTTSVSVTLACSPPAGNGGTIVVNGQTVICANIDSISVLPLETTVNNPIMLASTANAGGQPVTFAWTATAGTFDDATSANPVFTCPATPQMVAITLSVSPSNPICPTVTSRTVTVNCDTLSPTFTNVYFNIIGARCTGCHRPGGGGVLFGKLDMSTPAAAFANLVGVPAMGVLAGTSGVMCSAVTPPILRVAPGDSANSLIFNKTDSKLHMVNPVCGSPMPLPAANPPLTQAQVDLLKAWIDAGALNN